MYRHFNIYIEEWLHSFTEKPRKSAHWRYRFDCLIASSIIYPSQWEFFPSHFSSTYALSMILIHLRRGARYLLHDFTYGPALVASIHDASLRFNANTQPQSFQSALPPPQHMPMFSASRLPFFAHRFILHIGILFSRLQSQDDASRLSWVNHLMPYIASNIYIAGLFYRIYISRAVRLSAWAWLSIFTDAPRRQNVSWF